MGFHIIGDHFRRLAGIKFAGAAPLYSAKCLRQIGLPEKVALFKKFSAV